MPFSVHEEILFLPFYLQNTVKLLETPKKWKKFVCFIFWSPVQPCSFIFFLAFDRPFHY